MIVYPINVENIFGQYGFDENVIVAGFLYDIVEDTFYIKEDIEKIVFDIVSLVIGTIVPSIKVFLGNIKKAYYRGIKKIRFKS